MTATENTAARTREQLVQSVAGHVQRELGLPEPPLAEDTVLKELPGADSVKLVRVTALLEREFGAEFEDREVFAVRTLGQLVDLVERHGAGGGR